MEMQKPEGAGETMGLHQVGAGADRCFLSLSLRENAEFEMICS